MQMYILKLMELVTYVEIAGVVYSYGMYDSTYSPASESLATMGDGVC